MAQVRLVSMIFFLLGRHTAWFNRHLCVLCNVLHHASGSDDQLVHMLLVAVNIDLCLGNDIRAEG